MAEIKRFLSVGCFLIAMSGGYLAIVGNASGYAFLLTFMFAAIFIQLDILLDSLNKID